MASIVFRLVGSIFLIISLPTNASQNGLSLATKCTEIWVKAKVGLNNLRNANKNAAIAAKDYKNANSRNLNVITVQFGLDFEATLNNLLPGARILDLGGGFSVYGIELGRKGHRVMTVNAQDFYTDALHLLTDQNKAEAYVAALKLDGYSITMKGGVSSAGLQSLADALDVPIPDSLMLDTRTFGVKPETLVAQAASDLIEMVHKIQTKVSREEELGNFTRVVDMAKNVLRRTPSDSQDEIIDSFGAFFYSADRISLLEQYHRVLKNGKKAHIVTTHPYDKVKIENDTINLNDYLTKTYPEIFRTEYNHGVTTLIIQKSDAPIDFSELSAKLGAPKTVDHKTEHVNRPLLKFKLRPKK